MMKKVEGNERFQRIMDEIAASERRIHERREQWLKRQREQEHPVVRSYRPSYLPPGAVVGAVRREK